MSQALINSQKTITITQEDILHQIKLSCKLPEIVEQIVTRKVITTAIEEAGIEVTTAELQQAADQLRVMSQLKDAQSTWAWLEKHGLSLDDFEEIVYNTVIFGKLSAHLFQDKVEPYFYEHQLDYAGAVIYEIILEDEDEAIELFYEIQEGEITFFEAAQQSLPDTELRRQGGYRGQVDRAAMPPEVSAAVFAANPPQLLPPIVTSQGVHLILVEKIIHPVLDANLRSTILLNLFSKYIETQVNNYKTLYN